MFPINATADAIVNNYPVIFQKKRQFPDKDQHRLEHYDVRTNNLILSNIKPHFYFIMYLYVTKNSFNLH